MTCPFKAPSKQALLTFSFKEPQHFLGFFFLNLTHMRNLLFLAAVALFFSACNSTPDHARYIPGDAMAVVGVNFKKLGRDIAWSKIVGSDILDELERKAKEGGSQNNAAEDLQNAGLQTSGTAYLYVKHNALSGNRAVAIIPLKDRAKWAAYVKKTFPQAAVSTAAEKRSEARLSEDLFAGWSDDVLMLMNTTKKSSPEEMAAITDTTFSMPMPGESSRMDNAQMSAEMQTAFAQKKETSIVGNKRFKRLDGEGHDVSLWVNYEGLMNDMAGTGAGMMAMYANLYKGTALAAGFDFEKGHIAGEARYYVSEALKEAVQKMDGDAVDKDLLDRVPAQNLNALFALNLSPESMRAMLEKMNLLGIANLALAAQGFSVEDILESFEGDMVVALNDFKLATVTDTLSFSESFPPDPDAAGAHGQSGNATTYEHTEPRFNYIFSAKIGKREKLEKLLSWAVQQSALSPQGKGIYNIGNLTGTSNGVLLMDTDKDLLVLARDAAAARAFADKKSGGKLPEVAREAVYGHSMGAFFDVQTMMANLGSAFTSARDSLSAAEFKRVFSNFTAHSEGFKGDAFLYEMSANLMNKDENSLVQLLEFASRMRTIEREHAGPPAMDAAIVPFDAADTTALTEPADAGFQ